MSSLDPPAAAPRDGSVGMYSHIARENGPMLGGANGLDLGCEYPKPTQCRGARNRGDPKTKTKTNAIPTSAVQSPNGSMLPPDPNPGTDSRRTEQSD